MEQVNGLSIIIRRGIATCLVVGLTCTSLTAGATECARNVSPIKEGQVASCDGYLFSPKAESDAYKATQLSDLYKDQNQILEERLKLYINESTQLIKEKARRDTTEDLIRIGYFFGGMLATALVVRNVRP